MDFYSLPRDVQVAWAAGLFEGEGCITTSSHSNPRNGKRYHYYYPRLQIKMTDEDMIRRFHRVVGVGQVYGPYAGAKDNHKPCWDWRLTKKDDFYIVIELLRPFLGERRLARMEEVLSARESRIQG